MKLQIFAIRDRKTDQFANPMFAVSKGQAIRNLTDAVNNKTDDNVLNKHSEDFELYELGEWDTESGMFSTYMPRSVLLAETLKQ